MTACAVQSQAILDHQHRGVEGSKRRTTDGNKEYARESEAETVSVMVGEEKRDRRGLREECDEDNATPWFVEIDRWLGRPGNRSVEFGQLTTTEWDSIGLWQRRPLMRAWV